MRQVINLQIELKVTPAIEEGERASFRVLDVMKNGNERLARKPGAVGEWIWTIIETASHEHDLILSEGDN